MKRKNKIWLLIISIFLIFTTTCNSAQKTMNDKEHSHTHHESIIHIHQHTHLINGHSHSHYHSSNFTLLIDYFFPLPFSDRSFGVNKNENNFELISLHPKELINKLLKPPTIS